MHRCQLLYSATRFAIHYPSFSQFSLPHRRNAKDLYFDLPIAKSLASVTSVEIQPVKRTDSVITVTFVILKLLGCPAYFYAPNDNGSQSLRSSCTSARWDSRTGGSGRVRLSHFSRNY